MLGTITTGLVCWTCGTIFVSAEQFYRYYFYPLLAAFILSLMYNFYRFLCWRWEVYQENAVIQRRVEREKKEAAKLAKGKKFKGKQKNE